MRIDDLIALARERGHLPSESKIFISNKDARGEIAQLTPLEWTHFRCFCILPASRVLMHEINNPVRSIVFTQGGISTGDSPRPSPWPVVILCGGDQLAANTPWDIHFLDIPTQISTEKWKIVSSGLYLITRLENADVLETKTLPPIEDQSKKFTSLSSFGRATLGCRGKQTVETDPALYKKMDELFHFDHDPCPVLPEVDAMTTQWGKRNYINPPFSGTSGFFVKAIEEAEKHGAYSVVLCPAQTNTKAMFHVGKSGYLRGIVFLFGAIVFKGHTVGLARAIMLVVIGPRRVQLPRCYSWDPNIQESKRTFVAVNSLLTHFSELGWGV